MRTIHLSEADCLPDAEVEALAGQLLDDSYYDTLIEDDADVFKPDGTPLIMYRLGVLSHADCIGAYGGLRAAAGESRNRGIAAGPVNESTGAIKGVEVGSGKRIYRIKQDGTPSQTFEANPVLSGIVGYFDRNPRIPYCRTTAYTLKNEQKFAQSLPFIRKISNHFKATHPERWHSQHEMIQKTSPDFYIHDTVFTTVTVNLNWQTALHQDAGDYKGGFGVMTAIWKGKPCGCYLCYPKYRVAVNTMTTSVLLADVHEWHGNTPFTGVYGDYERLSFVLYYREKMAQCGSAADELEIAKKKRGGFDNEEGSQSLW